MIDESEKPSFHRLIIVIDQGFNFVSQAGVIVI